MSDAAQIINFVIHREAFILRKTNMMTPTNQTTEVLDFAGEGRPKLSTGLNVLTILTIIWSIITIVLGIWQYINAQKTYDDMRTSLESGKMDDAPEWVKKMAGPEALAMYQKMYENRLPILLIGLVGAGLCLYGAIEMRKLKKQGYMLWLIGEILPLVGGFIFIGSQMFSGFGLFGLLFPLIFIILYTIYRKDLVY